MNVNNDKESFGDNNEQKSNVEEDEMENQNDDDDRLSYVLITLGLDNIIQFF